MTFSKDILKVLKLVEKLRKIGKIKMIKQSCQSQCIFTISVYKKHKSPDGTADYHGNLILWIQQDQNVQKILASLYPLSKHSPDQCLISKQSIPKHLPSWWFSQLYMPFDLYLDGTKKEGTSPQHDGGCEDDIEGNGWKGIAWGGQGGCLVIIVPVIHPTIQVVRHRE